LSTGEFTVEGRTP